MWEEQLKLRSHLEERVAQLDREKAELLEQVSPENSPDIQPISRRTVFTFLLSSYILSFFPGIPAIQVLVIWLSSRKQIKASWVSLCEFWSGSVGKSSQCGLLSVEHIKQGCSSPVLS